MNKKTTSEKWKFNSNKKLGLYWAVNGLGKPFRKKSNPKNQKNIKNQSEIAACEQKTTTEKPNFCSNTVFSLYFKIRAKKGIPVGWTRWKGNISTWNISEACLHDGGWRAHKLSDVKIKLTSKYFKTFNADSLTEHLVELARKYYMEVDNVV